MPIDDDDRKLLPAPPEADPIRRAAAANTIDAALFIVKMFGNPGFVGMALCEAHYAGQPWVTSVQVAERVKCSDDTARRRLNELVAINRVECRTECRVRFYRVNPRVADSVMGVLLGAIEATQVFANMD
jgi:hypothetical protein